MDVQNKMGCRFESELWRGGKLIKDKPEEHKLLIIKKNQIIKIGLKRSSKNEE